MFGLVLATLSLIYFVTLVWGPKDQEDPAAKNYLKDLGDQPKAESSESPRRSSSARSAAQSKKFRIDSGFGF